VSAMTEKPEMTGNFNKKANSKEIEAKGKRNKIGPFVELVRE